MWRRIQSNKAPYRDLAMESLVVVACRDSDKRPGDGSERAAVKSKQEVSDWTNRLATELAMDDDCVEIQQV